MVAKFRIEVIMTENQAAIGLAMSVLVAYYIATYWRTLVFLVAVLVISVFGFGLLMLAQVIHGGSLTPGDHFVKTETTSHQR
jgi:hypothetical protein